MTQSCIRKAAHNSAYVQLCEGHVPLPSCMQRHAAQRMTLTAEVVGWEVGEMGGVG